MKTNTFTLFLLLVLGHAWGQERALNKALADSPRAYALFSADGEPVAWTDFVVEASQADVVFFGELHDDAIMHWLQAELVRDLDVGGLALTRGRREAVHED
ncbi:MAG: ChaN family lipoprotein, partial [Flavobacteriales bacterium]